MEDQSGKWNFKGKKELSDASAGNISSVITEIAANLNKEDSREVIPLGYGDPSSFPSFRTSIDAEDAVVNALRSAKHNYYPPALGLLPARRAIAEYLSQDLPYKLSSDDVYITLGGRQGIEIITNIVARPSANILLPRPGYPRYESYAAHNCLQVRHFDLLPEKSFEVDLEAVEALADDNTVAMVIINPGNPCGNVFSYDHLKKVAKTARKLGILVIADEVYRGVVFGNSPFVSMGVFGSMVPVITIGSFSKRWMVPGWRAGWLVKCDPNGILQESGIVDSIKDFLNLSPNPATFIQAAVPQILDKTKDGFFSKTMDVLREDVDICYNGIKEIPCITCVYKPEASMFVMVKLNLSLLEDINDDMDFCVKLAKEESVIMLPGTTLGMKNWLRITFAVEPSSLGDGLNRMKAFCQKHARKSQ